MPGIDFARVRAEIALADVLKLIGFVPCATSRDQVRGPCPLHHAASAHSRSFSANLTRHIYRCFKCGSAGNQLELYARVTGLSLFEAAIALCRQLHHEIPWTQSSKRGLPQADRATRQIEPRGARGPASVPGSHHHDGPKDHLPSPQVRRPICGCETDTIPPPNHRTTSGGGSPRNR